ncbi:MAG: hypothetical protein ABL962_09425 [Fimbriimonadaceae bacterium]
MIIATLLITQSSAFAVFDACGETHRKMRSASAVVAIVGKSAARYEVSFIQPDRARIRLSSIAAGGTAASERVFTLVGSKCYGLDLKTNEWLERSVATTGNLAHRMSSVIGQLDDPANFLLVPGASKGFLAPFKTMPGWVVSKNSAEITAKTNLKGIGSYTLVFSAIDKRLLSADMLTGQARTRWTYTYRTAPTSIKWSPPAGSRKVTMFKDRAVPPSFATASARAIYESARTAYRKLPTLNYRVADDSQTFDIKFTRSSASQKNRLYSFSYANGVLNFGKKSVKCSSADIGIHLEKAKIGIEPVLRALIHRLNPIERLLTDGMTVRVAGNLKIGNAMNDLIEGKTKDYRITLAIRRDNHLLSSTISENYDGRGQRVARVERRFTYR